MAKDLSCKFDTLLIVSRAVRLLTGCAAEIVLIVPVRDRPLALPELEVSYQHAALSEG